MDKLTTDTSLQKYGQEPPGVVPTSGRTDAPILLSGAGVVVALATVVLSYVLMRYSGDSPGLFVGVISLCLVVLAVLAAIAGRVGGLATFVVIALLLPWAGALAAAGAFADRVESGIADLFGDDAESSAWSLGGGDDEADEDAPSVVAAGETGTLHEMTVSVTGFECSSTLTQVVRNPDYWSDSSSNEYIDAQAPSGKQFCTVTSNWSNDSSSPTLLIPDMAITAVATVDGTSYAASGEDDDYSSVLTERVSGPDMAFGTLNPGDDATVVNVFTVPADTEFETAQGKPSIFTDSKVLFALP